jgi:UrcA family protein
MRISPSGWRVREAEVVLLEANTPFFQEHAMNTNTASPHLRGLIAAAVLGTLAAGFAGVSTAADPSEVRSKAVHYADLNLSTPRGAAALYRRIKLAAQEVCGWNADDILVMQVHTRPCVDKAIADAVTRVGRVELTAIYNANHRQPLTATLAAVQPR